MFKGFVLSESLRNPTILNKFRKIYVKVEDHPESRETRFWHLFKLELDDGEVEKMVEQLMTELKEGWYAHFWNDNVVYISFPGRHFKVPRETQGAFLGFEAVKAYGLQHGIEERYLDFWIED